ncbi:hypothetical protein BJF79_38250 [Actinomadura sp. CNU-125]|uniref:DUF4132 domain-containing protein n=1 Tax=Actinomadura sp. CNU-125 TaxID=1904961 RepID=UPI000968D668|nr:DUF4132 domain-containing protein [Actinomadura sp. CNU-125]OLT30757.1 hypothetical protein BJF79_38250 [Actinomadura sp. CNU-125]
MDETVGIPVEWREHIHPRRGGVAGRTVVPDEDAARRARELAVAARPIAVETAEHERTDPVLGKAVRAWLDGEPDPVGAAAVAAVAVKYLDRTAGGAFLDAWVLEHGLAFAACAVTEAVSVELGPVPVRATRGSGTGVAVGAFVAHTGSDRPAGWRGEIRRMTDADAFPLGRWVAEGEDGGAVVERLRALLAAAPEDEYRDAVARLAAHRGDARRRRAVSYLVPTETAWTDESLKDLDDSGHRQVLRYDHVLASLSGAAHVERIGRVGWITVSPAMVGTLLDGLGADAFPLLDQALRRRFRNDADETRPLLVRALLEIPDERLFPTLLDGFGEKDMPAALVEAAGRHPVQAVRALAPLAEDGTTRGLRVAGVLRGLLYGDPALVGELPARAAEELRPRPSVPDAGGLPSVLAGKPGRSAKVDWADPALLPPIRTRGGDRALPADATRNLLRLLAAKPAAGSAASADIAAVRAFCDRHSLAEFSWALFQRWFALGAATKHNWALAQLGLIGDDTTVRRLGPLIRIWPSEGGAARANTGLDVLAGIGSDVALTHLFELTRRGKTKGLRARAAAKIDEIAAARGITPEGLADRAVPDFGLDGTGTLVLDYGPRRFTVTFDERLVPLVAEPNGKIRKSAPKPGPKDDPVLAPAAHALFTGLKKDVRTIAGQEIGRLELAMIDRRGWSPDDFRALFVEHPLLGHIVRRLVWITDTGTAFRVAEDRTYADVADEPFTPAPDARVAIAHPVLLDDLDAWVELFADYEILQPFEQLGRAVHRLTEDERTAHRLARVEGLVLPYGKAKGHSQGRWESVDADGGFAGGWLARRDPAGLYVVADLSPGLYAYMYGEGDDQTIGALWAGPAPANAPTGTVPLGAVDPVTMSEAVRDLVRSAS